MLPPGAAWRHESCHKYPITDNRVFSDLLITQFKSIVLSYFEAHQRFRKCFMLFVKTPVYCTVRYCTAPYRTVPYWCHQPISVAVVSWRVNDVTCWMSPCLQNMYFFYLDFKGWGGTAAREPPSWLNNFYSKTRVILKVLPCKQNSKCPFVMLSYVCHCQPRTAWKVPNNLSNFNRTFIFLTYFSQTP